MIIEGLGCTKWSESDGATLEAREELVMLLGPHSVLSKPNPKKVKDEQEYVIMSDNRQKLRLIAIKSGILQKMELAKSLRWSEEELLEKLEETYENCKDWSPEDIDMIISELGSSSTKSSPAASTSKSKVESSDKEEVSEEKPAPKKRRKRSKKKEEAPVAEKVEASDLDPTDLTAEANTKKKRSPATRKKRTPVKSSEENTVIQIDGKQIIEEFGLGEVQDQVVANQKLLAGLTLEAEDSKVAVAELTATVEKLAAVVSSIEKFCVWFYNSETEDEISKLTEVFK